MSALANALDAQRRLIAARQSEAITELRRHDPECCMCGDGPTDGVELRMVESSPISVAEMWCAACFGKYDEATFTDYPLVWAAMKDANR